MIPVDAQIWTEPDVRRDGFSLETVLGEINSRGAGVKIALIDASRRNPFERRFRSFSAGLAPVIAPNGTLVMYSAALSLGGQRQWRRPQPVRQELLKEIRVPDLTAEETLNRTRVGVTRASRSEQVPWISSSLAEDFSFIPGGAGHGPGRTRRPRWQASGRRRPRRAPSHPPPPPAPSRRRRASNRRPRRRRRRSNRAADATAPEAAGQARSHRAGACRRSHDQDADRKLVENPDDANALYRRGQVYASKGAYASRSRISTSRCGSIRRTSKPTTTAAGRAPWSATCRRR